MGLIKRFSYSGTLSECNLGNSGYRDKAVCTVTKLPAVCARVRGSIPPRLAYSAIYTGMKLSELETEHSCPSRAEGKNM